MRFCLIPIQLASILAGVEEDAAPAEENVPHGGAHYLLLPGIPTPHAACAAD